jgi:hypothetical protein
MFSISVSLFLSADPLTAGNRRFKWRGPQPSSQFPIASDFRDTQISLTFE